MSALFVLANGARVGTLEVEDGRWTFRYASEWAAFALSPNLPIATCEFTDSAHVDRLRIIDVADYDFWISGHGAQG